MDVTSLFVKEIYANEGPTMKDGRRVLGAWQNRYLNAKLTIGVVVAEKNRRNDGSKLVHTVLRVGIIKDWDSRWYSNKKNFGDLLVEDNTIKYIKKRLYTAGISRIYIDRTAMARSISIFLLQTGLVVGKGGENIKILRDEVER